MCEVYEREVAFKTQCGDLPAPLRSGVELEFEQEKGALFGAGLYQWSLIHL